MPGGQTPAVARPDPRPGHRHDERPDPDPDAHVHAHVHLVDDGTGQDGGRADDSDLRIDQAPAVPGSPAAVVGANVRVPVEPVAPVRCAGAGKVRAP